MKKNLILFIIIISVAIGGFVLGKKSGGPATAILPLADSPTPQASPEPLVALPIGDETANGLKTFKFHNFHGQDLGTGGFEFQYPANWQNDGQYFSPQDINHYDITSADAPVYYDLVSKDIFDTGDLKYQITTDKRNHPDSTVKIDNRTFHKYDLIDYQSDGSDRVIIYLGPGITIFGNSYYLVFRWEQNPLTIEIPGNNPAIFEKMVSTVKFNE